MIRRDGLRRYRLLQAHNVIEGLELAAVEQLLARAGVDLGDLVEIKGEDSATHRIGAA